MKVLHIDDSPQIRELYKDMFTADKHSIKSVYSGMEGLELLMQNDYDLILLDLYMPEYNGIQFIRDLQNTRSSELKKVVVISSHRMDEEHLKEFLNFGIRLVESNPTSLDNIVNMQDNLLVKEKISC